MKFKYLVCLIPILFLNGCYNYQELNDLSITTALGIDKTDDGYKLIAQVVNTQKSNPNSNDSANPKITIYSASGKTIQDAIRSIMAESPNKLYIYQLQILLIGDSVAKDGIKDILDIFFRGVESRKQFYVLVSKDVSAEKVLQTLTPIETIVSSNIKKSLITESRYLGVTQLITFENMMGDYLNNNIEITLPSITLKGNENIGDNTKNIETSNPSAKVVLSNIAIFKGDKLINYMSKDDSIALSFIDDKVVDSIISYECSKNKYTVVRIIDANTDIRIKKNELKIIINIKGNANLSETNCQVNLEKNEVIKKIEKNTNKEIEKMIMNAIANVQKNDNSDIFGFLDLFYKNNYIYYKKIKKNWYKDNFKNLKIEVKSNVNLVEKGNILRVIESEK